MKRVQQIIVGTTAAMALAAAATAAPYWAGAGCDGSGPGYGAGRMGMMHGMGPGPGGGMGGAFWRGSEQGLAQLKAQLAINAEQEGAWQSFAGKAAEQASQMQALHAQRWQATPADASAPAQMSLHIGLMTQRLASMQALNTALTELYAVLTPEQRTTADAYFGQRGSRQRGPRS
jgi:hypothetical protein